MIGSRSRSREIALQVLYSCDTVRAPTPELWSSTLEDAESTPEVKAFAQELVAGTLAQRGEIDGLIASAAENWELSRLAAVDRNILRLAVHELASRHDIPAKVSINEAIELGKRYSTAQSGAFINGILDRVRRDLGRPVDDSPSPPLEPRRRPAAASGRDGQDGMAGGAGGTA
jgi:transcription antitermination protein NusB